MYRQIVHFLQGQVLVRIECGCPERMLNLCGARGIPFWELTCCLLYTSPSPRD